MRWTGRLALATVIASLMTASAAAQAYVFVGGGATIPVGDYGDVAKTGWVGNAGITFDLGDQGVWVGGEGFYGSNKHDDTSGDKTNLYGASGLLGYNVQNSGSVHPYVYGGAGFLSHQDKPAASAASSETESKFNWLGAAGLTFEVSGSVGLWVEGRYDGAKDTQHVTIQGGLNFRLGRR